MPEWYENALRLKGKRQRRGNQLGHLRPNKPLHGVSRRAFE